MAIHMSIRLAWHNEGWNGHICKKPCENSYCVGEHSYPPVPVHHEHRDRAFDELVAFEYEEHPYRGQLPPVRRHQRERQHYAPLEHQVVQKHEAGVAASAHYARKARRLVAGAYRGDRQH